MKYSIILFMTIILTSCSSVKMTEQGFRMAKNTLDAKPHASQLERDIDSCGVGKPLYTKCTPYIGMRTKYIDWSQSKSWTAIPQSEWVNECPEGEKQIFLNLFGAKPYIRNQDIKQCMNEKGYSYKAPKWMKNKIDNLYQSGYRIKDIGKHSLEESENTLKVPIDIQKQTFIKEKNVVKSSINYIESLKKAKDLFSSGVISKKEFESIKAKIIDEI
jgi:hypothetical protein